MFLNIINYILLWIGQVSVDLELIRDNFKKLAVIVLIGILFFWSLNNYKTVLGSFGNIVSFFTPFIMGLCFAFVVNVLLRLTEKTWSNVFKNRRGRIYTKLKRPLCLIISLIIIIGVIFVILFIIVPELNRTVSLKEAFRLMYSKACSMKMP